VDCRIKTMGSQTAIFVDSKSSAEPLQVQFRTSQTLSISRSSTLGRLPPSRATQGEIYLPEFLIGCKVCPPVQELLQIRSSYLICIFILLIVNKTAPPSLFVEIKEDFRQVVCRLYLQQCSSPSIQADFCSICSRSYIIK
jgi:hypothetical protein